MAKNDGEAARRAAQQAKDRADRERAAEQARLHRNRTEETWQEDPLLLAAAFEGTAKNVGYGYRDRLAAALQAIKLLHQVIDELKDEIAGC